MRLLILLALLATPTLAAEDEHVAEAGRIRIVHAWAQATAGPDGAVFMDIENRGPADRLVSAATPLAAAAELHGAVLEGGKATSRSLGPLDLPAGQEFELEPGAIFVKLAGLRQPLRQGEEFELTLGFAAAGSATVHVEVEAADARQHSHAGHAH